MKVRHIEKGINPSSIHQIFFTGDYLAKGFKIGVVAGMIALTVSNHLQPISSYYEYNKYYLHVSKPFLNSTSPLLV